MADPLDVATVGLAAIDPVLGFWDRYTFRHDPILYGGLDSQIGMYNDWVNQNQGGYRQPEYDYLRQLGMMDPTQAMVQNYQQLAQMQRPWMQDETAGLSGLLGRSGGFQEGYQSPMFSPYYQAAPEIANFGQAYTPSMDSRMVDQFGQQLHPYQGMDDTLEDVFGGGLQNQPQGGGSGGSNTLLGDIDRALFPNQGQYLAPFGQQLYNITHPFGGAFSQNSGGQGGVSGVGLQTQPQGGVSGSPWIGSNVGETINNITHPIQTITGGRYGFGGNDASQAAGTKEMIRPPMTGGQPKSVVQSPYQASQGQAGYVPPNMRQHWGPSDPSVFSPELGGWGPAPSSSGGMTGSVTPKASAPGTYVPPVSIPGTGTESGSTFTPPPMTGGQMQPAQQTPQQSGGAAGQQPAAFQDYVNNPQAQVNQARSNLQTGAYNTAVTNPTGQVDQARRQLGTGAYASYTRNPAQDVSMARHNLNQGVYGDLMQNPTSFSDQVVQDLLRSGETSINQQSMGTRRQMLNQAGAGTAGGGAMDRRLFDLEMNRQNQMSQLGRDVRTQQALQNFQDMMGVAGMQAGVEQGLAGMGLQARQGAAGLQSGVEQGLAGLGTSAIMQGAGLQSGTEQGLAQMGLGAQQGAANLQFGAEQALANQMAQGNYMRQGMYDQDFQNMGRMIGDMRGLGSEEMQRRMAILNQIGNLGEQGQATQQALIDAIMRGEAARLMPTAVSQVPYQGGGGYYGGGGSGEDWAGALTDLGGALGQYAYPQNPW